MNWRDQAGIPRLVRKRKPRKAKPPALGWEARQAREERETWALKTGQWEPRRDRPA